MTIRLYVAEEFCFRGTPSHPECWFLKFGFPLKPQKKGTLKQDSLVVIYPLTGTHRERRKSFSCPDSLAWCVQGGSFGFL